MNISNYFKKEIRLIDSQFKKYFGVSKSCPKILNESMAYSVFAGGKRLRPILCLAAARVCGGSIKKVLPTACALEMIHTYSLIHDDLPAMDNDDLRRGKPTSHIKYGEGIAILAGDGLLTRAFEIMDPMVVKIVAFAAGVSGMIGGQVMDLLMEHNRCPANRRRENVEYIHLNKTAKMIEVSLVSGAVLSGAGKRQIDALAGYGRKIGIAFQISDDILDILGDKKKLGKRGSDADNEKLTYPSVFGIDASARKSSELIQSAKNDLKIFGRPAVTLSEIADFVINREK